MWKWNESRQLKKLGCREEGETCKMGPPGSETCCLTVERKAERIQSQSPSGGSIFPGSREVATIIVERKKENININSENFTW